uniref:Uncharacterized protein n=1 Tax=Compsopogon caeruleus TaxID=31354 RepID=A0A7S1XGS1_9RHOD|mmetsp:Transcript_7184/g.14768  ORF Transcript_7184/g.14768 Transcript_7184/m.14768 type:complete len:101 (+) Transcript_7184:300-602(+)
MAGFIALDVISKRWVGCVGGQFFFAKYYCLVKGLARKLPIIGSSGPPDLCSLEEFFVSSRFRKGLIGGRWDSYVKDASDVGFAFRRDAIELQTGRKNGFY